MSHLYVHIPFCAERCAYCDFATTTNLRAIDDYVNLICREINLLYSRYPLPLKTIYFGGGTPSLLPIAAFQKIIGTITASFGAVALEFTVEVNPESASDDLIAALVSLGVNRISLGMQARQERLLKILGRNSRYGQVWQTVNALQHHGITNYNIDLIYGIPEQTLDDVVATVDDIVNLRATHVSAYALKLESAVPLARRVASGALTLPSDDAYADMLDVIIARLAQNGLARYEVANFAKVGYHSVHNSAYWSAADTLGVGLAAAYKVAGRRFYNTASLADYASLIGQSKLPLDDAKTERLTAADRAYEYAILNLRTVRGIHLADYRAKFGYDFKTHYAAWCDKYRNYGVLLEVDGHLRLTDHGLNTANYILSDL